MENEPVREPETLQSQALDVILSKLSYNHSEINTWPAQIKKIIWMGLSPVMQRFFMTLEDRLCISCAWDEDVDLGDNGAVPLDVKTLLYHMNDEHYVTVKFWYNKYTFPSLPNLNCLSCGKMCHLEDDGSHHLNDEVMPGEVVEKLYQQKYIQFHEDY